MNGAMNQAINQAMNPARHAGRAEIDQAIAAMLDEYRNNDWMLNEHWPLNEPHVRLMIADVMARFTPGPDGATARCRVLQWLHKFPVQPPRLSRYRYRRL